MLNTASPGSALDVLATSDTDLISNGCSLTYEWSIVETGSFNGVTFTLDSTSSPKSLTIGDLTGSVTSGTYSAALELKVVDTKDSA